MVQAKSSNDTATVTIMKYRLGDDFLFHVMDKFDYPDEVERLDAMIEYSEELAQRYGPDYDQLWIKTTILF